MNTLGEILTQSELEDYADMGLFIIVDAPEGKATLESQAKFLEWREAKKSLPDGWSVLCDVAEAISYLESFDDSSSRVLEYVNGLLNNPEYR